jgi:hypothetical protein
MKILLRTISLLCLAMLLKMPAQAASEPERSMGVRGGPEQVFTRPVTELVPQLQGAVATNVNGRVGPELVFWGYRLSNGAAANLFGCALVDGVDCEARALQICANGSTRLQSSIVEPGNMVRRTCVPVGNAGVGDLRPGCTDNETTNDLLVGLVDCPGN